MTERSGEVFDLGYQHYDGPREGRTRARLAIWVNGVRTALGLGRGPRAKILPTLLFVAAMGPAIILILIASVADVGDQVPGFAGYYQIVSITLLLFAAIIAPELLCTDRRDRVLDLYLVRPITPVDYAGARWLSFFSIALALVYSGQIVLFIGLTLVADEPLEYLRANWLQVPRFLAAGALLAIFITTLPLAVSAFTYPLTSYESEGVFLVIGGSPEWKCGDEPWRRVEAGDIICREFGGAEGKRPGDEPMLALYAWMYQQS